jgi:hypothetical protein
MELGKKDFIFVDIEPQNDKEMFQLRAQVSPLKFNLTNQNILENFTKKIENLRFHSKK